MIQINKLDADCAVGVLYSERISNIPRGALPSRFLTQPVDLTGWLQPVDGIGKDLADADCKFETERVMMFFLTRAHARFVRLLGIATWQGAALALFALANVGTSGVARAEYVNIDVQFGCTSAPCSGSLSAGTTPAMVGPAVVGNAGDFWNMAAGGGGSISALKNTSGNATGVSLQWTAGGQWNQNLGGGAGCNTFFNTAFCNTQYRNLMGSYLIFSPYNSGGSLSIGGLDPLAAYDIYFYSQANHNSNGRALNIDANGVQVSTLQVDADNRDTFVLGENYAFAQSVIADANGNIVVGITVPLSTYEGNLNGFQLIGGTTTTASNVPEPVTLYLTLIGLAGLGYGRRARLAKLAS